MTSARIAVILGTRPEILKLADVIRLLGDRALIVHTGQHWDHSMSGQFLEFLDLPTPDIQLDVGGASRGEQIASVLSQLNKLFIEDPPNAVVVQGDTNAVVAGALAANANGIPLFHVEAGLRSHDRAMPEEHNRVITDHLADLCLAPTDQSHDNLLTEGIPPSRIEVTGNTIVGILTRVLADLAPAVASTLTSFGLVSDGYIVATIHRPENTDDAATLGEILSNLGSLSEPVLFPMHPRTRARVEEFGLQKLLEPLQVVDPLGYEEFVIIAANAVLSISDSGGVQEEASVWKRPVLVVRRSTERPEVQGTFARLVSPGQELLSQAQSILDRRLQTHAELEALASPYGDAHAAKRTVDAIDRWMAHPPTDR